MEERDPVRDSGSRLSTKFFSDGDNTEKQSGDVGDYFEENDLFNSLPDSIGSLDDLEWPEKFLTASEELVSDGENIFGSMSPVDDGLPSSALGEKKDNDDSTEVSVSTDGVLRDAKQVEIFIDKKKRKDCSVAEGKRYFIPVHAKEGRSASSSHDKVKFRFRGGPSEKKKLALIRAGNFRRKRYTAEKYYKLLPTKKESIEPGWLLCDVERPNVEEVSPVRSEKKRSGQGDNNNNNNSKQQRKNSSKSTIAKNKGMLDANSEMDKMLKRLVVWEGLRALLKQQFALNRDLILQIGEVVDGFNKGDIAYLYRVENGEEDLQEGDVVGVFQDRVSRETKGAQFVSVVATQKMIRLKCDPDGLQKEVDVTLAWVVHSGRAPVRLHKDEKSPDPNGNYSVYVSGKKDGTAVIRRSVNSKGWIGYFVEMEESGGSCMINRIFPVPNNVCEVYTAETVLKRLQQQLPPPPKFVLERSFSTIASGSKFLVDQDPFGLDPLSLLIAEGGMGKTTAVQCWLSRLPTDFSAIGFISLKEFISWCRRKDLLRVDGPEFLRFLLPRKDVLDYEKAWAALISHHSPLVLVLDGFDEVTSIALEYEKAKKKTEGTKGKKRKDWMEEKDKVESIYEFLQALRRDDVACRLGLPEHIHLVVTTRPDVEHQFGKGWKRSKLDSLRADQISACVDAGLKGRSSKLVSLVDNLCEDWRIDSPFLVNIMCRLAEHKPELLENASSMPKLMKDFVAVAVERLGERPDVKESEDELERIPKDGRRKKLLEQLRGFAWSQMCSSDVQEVTVSAIKKLKKLKESDLLCVDKKNDIVSFRHQLFTEYFSAWHAWGKIEKVKGSGMGTLSEEHFRATLKTSSSFATFLATFCLKKHSTAKRQFLLGYFLRVLKDTTTICEGVVLLIEDRSVLDAFEPRLCIKLLPAVIRHNREEMFHAIVKLLENERDKFLLLHCIRLAARFQQEEMMRVLIDSIKDKRRGMCYACAGAIDGRQNRPVEFLMRFFGEDYRDDLVVECADQAVAVGNKELTKNLLSKRDWNGEEMGDLLDTAACHQNLSVYQLLRRRLQPSEASAIKLLFVLKTVARFGWAKELLQDVDLLRTLSPFRAHEFFDLEPQVIEKLFENGVQFGQDSMYDLLGSNQRLRLRLVPLLLPLLENDEKRVGKRSRCLKRWLEAACKWTGIDVVELLLPEVQKNCCVLQNRHGAERYDSAWDFALKCSIQSRSDRVVEYLLSQLEKHPIRNSALRAAAAVNNEELLDRLLILFGREPSVWDITDMLCAAVVNAKCLDGTFQVVWKYRGEVTPFLLQPVWELILQCPGASERWIGNALEALPWKKARSHIDGCLCRAIEADNIKFALFLFKYRLQREGKPSDKSGAWSKLASKGDSKTILQFLPAEQECEFGGACAELERQKKPQIDVYLSHGRRPPHRPDIGELLKPFVIDCEPSVACIANLRALKKKKGTSCMHDQADEMESELIGTSLQSDPNMVRKLRNIRTQAQKRVREKKWIEADELDKKADKLELGLCCKPSNDLVLVKESRDGVVERITCSECVKQQMWRFGKASFWECPSCELENHKPSRIAVLENCVDNHKVFLELCREWNVVERDWCVIGAKRFIHSPSWQQIRGLLELPAEDRKAFECEAFWKEMIGRCLLGLEHMLIISRGNSGSEHHASDKDVALWKFFRDFVLCKMNLEDKVQTIQRYGVEFGHSRPILRDGEVLFDRELLLQNLVSACGLSRETLVVAKEKLFAVRARYQPVKDLKRLKLLDELMQTFVDASKNGDKILLTCFCDYMPVEVLNDALYVAPSELVQFLVCKGAHPMSRFGWNRVVLVLDTNILMHKLDDVKRLVELEACKIVLPQDVPKELDGIHKNRLLQRARQREAQLALKYVRDHDKAFVRADNSHMLHFEDAAQSNDDQIMECAGYFSRIGGKRTVLLTADVALGVISNGNGIRVEQVNDAFFRWCGKVATKSSKLVDPLDVVEFLLQHEKTDPSLISLELFGDQTAAFKLVVQMKLCHALRTENYRCVCDLVDQNHMSLSDVLSFSIKNQSNFGLSFVVDEKKQFNDNIPFHEHVEVALKRLNEEMLPTTLVFFCKFKHKNRQGFTQGIVGLAKVFSDCLDIVVEKMCQLELWFPLKVLVKQCPESCDCVAQKLPQPSQMESDVLKTIRKIVTE